MNVYRPYMKALFTLKFEAGTAYHYKSSIDMNPTSTKNGNQRLKNSLTKADHYTIFPTKATYDYTERIRDLDLMASAQSAGASSNPDVYFKGFLIPSRAKLERNSAALADVLELTIPYPHFPFDPRSLLACAVRFYMGNMSEQDYEIAQTKGINHVLSGTPIDALSDLQFLGLVDTITTSWGENASVSFSARDYTAIFLDEEIPPIVPLYLKMKDSVKDILARLIFLHPAGRELKIRFFDSGNRLWDSPLEKFISSALVGKPKKKTPNTLPKMTMWDYIQKLCEMIGVSIQVNKDEVYISPPSTIVSRNSNIFQNHPTETFKSEGFYKNRVFIFGENCSNLSIKKSFQGKRFSGVIARAIDPITGIALETRFPKKPEPVKDFAGVGASAVEDFTNYKMIRVTGVTDIGVLHEAAIQYYNQMNRQEISGSLTTKNLRSFTGEEGTADIMLLRSGDAIDILSSGKQPEINEDLFDTASNIQTIVTKLKNLKHPIFSSDMVIDSVITAMRTASFIQTFRVESVTHMMDSKNGYSADISFKNWTTLFFVDKSKTLTPDALVVGQNTLYMDPMTFNPNTLFIKPLRIEQNILYMDPMTFNPNTLYMGPLIIKTTKDPLVLDPILITRPRDFTPTLYPGTLTIESIRPPPDPIIVFESVVIPKVTDLGEELRFDPIVFKVIKRESPE